MKTQLTRRKFLKTSSLATADGLTVKLPEKAPTEHAVMLRIKGLAV